MSSLLLSDEERERFASWLEREIESDKQIIEQTLKLGAHGEMLARHLKTKMAAFIVVARDLRNTESMKIE